MGARRITNKGSLRNFKSGQKGYKSGQRDFKSGKDYESGQELRIIAEQQ